MKWRKILATTGLVLVGGLGLWFGQLQWQTHQLGEEKFQQSDVPTVMLAGYGGNQWTYNGMIQRLTSAHIAHLALKITVAADGKLTIERHGKLNKNPLIQVLFVNNKDFRGEQRQLLPVLARLKSHYHVNTMNLMGHSMGGGVGLNTILSAQQPQYPQITKFVAIGSPFTGLGKQPDQSRVKALKQQLTALPKQLKMLNLAGDVFGTKGDLEVAAATVWLKGILPATIDYHQVLISGDILTSEHSFLHENSHVDRLIAQFLWQ